MRTCKSERVTIAHGRNRWTLVRTNRDAPTVDEVIQTTGAVLRRFLGNASPLATRGFFEVIQDPHTPGVLGSFIIGAARPVDIVYVSQDPPTREMQSLGGILGRSQDCKKVRLVKSNNPWFVVVDFDWRGEAVQIPWPARAVDIFGDQQEQTHSLDWLLAEARLLSPKTQKPDTTLAAEFSSEAKRLAKEAAAFIDRNLKPDPGNFVIVAGIATALLLAYGYARKGAK